jgi:hypothetical protein
MANIEAQLNVGFDVNVTQLDMSRGSLHIEIETMDANISLFASEKQIEEFISRLEYSLQEYRKKR